MNEPTASGIFERHHLRVYRFLLRQTADAALAEDLAQETFTRVVGALARYEPRQREASWVFRIARNVLKDRWTADRRAPGRVDDPPADGPAVAVDPTLGHDLRQALAAVPSGEREALLLREYGGLAYEEISQITGATPAAVRSRIYRGRRALRVALSPARGVTR